MKMKLFGWSLICSLMVLGLMGCLKKVNYPNCKKDGDCVINKDGVEHDGICIFGMCQECANTGDCPTGSMCRDTKCDAACQSDDDCRIGAYCGGGFCHPECKSNNDCLVSQTCERGRCMTDYAHCLSGKDCPNGYSCKSGFCSKDSSIAGYAAYCHSAKMVFFDFDKSNLSKSTRSVLDTVAGCAEEHPSSNFVIEGHCDSRGTTEYNLALGERRALSAKDYLVNMGVNQSHMKVVSYGKEKPLIDEENPAAWAKNRRDVIKVK